MAQLATADINDLPDADFALIEPGGTKDSSGKTVPRSLRHFPLNDKAHAANALARLPQSGLSADDKAKARTKIVAAAKRFGIEVSSGQSSLDDFAGDMERRYLPGPVECRAASDGSRIVGYASVFGKLSRNLGGFVERVEPTAFNTARQQGWPDAVCRYDHDSSMLLGTTAGRTLDLSVDRTGLFYDVLPPQSRADILELVTRGDIQHSSFAFRVAAGGDSWEATTDQGYPMRSLHDVQLVDVAPVLRPAYPDASAGLRSLALQVGAPLEDVLRHAENDELRKFFVRTDRATGRKTPKRPERSRGIFGPSAALQLLRRREDPWAGRE